MTQKTEWLDFASNYAQKTEAELLARSNAELTQDFDTLAAGRNICERSGDTAARTALQEQVDRVYAIRLQRDQIAARSMKQDHTPGPWRLADDMRGVGNFRVHGVEGPPGYGSVANCGTGDDGAANARLIVAAPDLLAALHAALDCIEKHVPATVFAPREMSRAAIAKATAS
jgi:hypothetical protein